jgi:hypothetical protein
MFMPPITIVNVDADGFLSSTDQTAARDAAVTFLEAIGVDVGTGGTQKLRPIVTGSPWNRYGVVTQVRVDNVIDTQRRRRRQLEGTTINGTPSY